ncbi:hypothetical protein, partial [Niastella yeongjuensis]
MNMKAGFYASKPLTFKCTFRIEKENTDYYQLKSDLSRSLVRFFEISGRFRDSDNSYQNVVYGVINDIFQRRFMLTGNTQAYLTDYSERSGSLLITFSILVVGAISNYGSIRETIDYFSEDIERVFVISLNSWNNGYTITSDIQEQNNQAAIVESQQISSTDTITYNSLLSKIKVDRILIGVVFFLLLVLIGQNLLVNTDTSKKDETNERT